MKRFTEENGAKLAVIQQATFFPAEGLSDEAFLKVLIPSQQAAGRKLLREGYLIRSEGGGVVLSPLVKENHPSQIAWDENLRSFFIRLVTSLAESILDYDTANKWAEQAQSNQERLRMLVFQHSRATGLSPLQKRLSEEALTLFVHDTQVLSILPEAKRKFLIDSAIAIEKLQNLALLRKQAQLIVPTLENVLEQVGDIPAQHLFRAYDWLSDLFIILADSRMRIYLDKWRLLKAAAGPAFSTVEAGLGALYDPRSGDKTVGEMYRRLKEAEDHEE